MVTPGARSVSRTTGRTRRSELRRLLWHVRRDPRQAGLLVRSLPALARGTGLHLPVSGRVAAAAASGGRLPLLPQAPLVTRPDRRDLRVLVLLDEFSRVAFDPEWHQVCVTPDDWRQELDRGDVDLLLVESAWRGNGGTWTGAMTGTSAPSQPLRDLVAACREAGVPTVFWNKEDPPNYERFVETARLFDVVHTVDVDCVERYRADLGHDRVHVLPFAAQPAVHNPAHGGMRHAYEVAFAGTWFAEKHEDRRRQLELLLDAASDHELHIYSRLQGEDERYRFPDRFADRVVGTLDYQAMLSAYRSYKVFLNVNSVTTSPTMCARRVFELSACGTAVVSTPSEGIAATFGDLVGVADDTDSARSLLRALLNNPEERDRRAHRAMRAVLSEHTYAHRVDDVLRSVDLPVPGRRRQVSAVVPTMRPDMVPRVLGHLGRQTHPDLEVVVMTHGFALDEARVEQLRAESGLTHLSVHQSPREHSLGRVMQHGADLASGDLVAKVDDDNYYAPHYLADLVAAFGYTDAAVVGKLAHYVHLEGSGANLLRFGEWEHRYVERVQGGTMVMDADVVREIRFGDLPRAIDTDFLGRARAAGHGVYSADRYNFLSHRSADTAGHTWTISDTELLAHQSVVQFYGPGEQHVDV